MLSIVIPSYNERENIEDIISRVTETVNMAGIETEIIIVDDDSPDKTWEHVQTLSARYPVRVIRRVGKRGLSSAVIDGWTSAKGDILGVMDADGSHDLTALVRMVEAVNSGKFDMAVGSRYIPGGGCEGWPWFRLLTSKVAIMFAKPVTNLKDATSGYAVFRKDAIDGIELDPIGWKIVLEVAVKGNIKRIKEIPIIFRDREKGKSKLGKNAIMNYLEHIDKLKKWMKENKKEKV